MEAIGLELVETELKFQLSRRQVDRLKRRPALRDWACSQLELDNIYFDTADRLLQKHRMSLRLRRANGRWLQTFKTLGLRSGAMTRRSEWETSAKIAADGSGYLDLRRFGDSRLRSLLSRQKRAPRLQPVFRTKVSRTLWTVERDQTEIEVALDAGEITAQLDGKPVREQILELELELKRGAAPVLIDFAIDLMDGSGKAPLLLLPLARSKAERGYQLVSSQHAGAVKASAKGFTEKLSRKMSSAQALRAVMAHGLSVVAANCELLLRADDSEYIHQARVALRRIRSAIRVLDRAPREVPQSLIDELSWLARALGSARDWDVFMEQTLPALQKDAGAMITATVLGRAEQHRCDRHVKLRDAIRSIRYAGLILNGERWCMSPVPANALLLEDMAETTLQRSARKLFKSAHFFSALSPERRHRVRIQAKRLRYALDLFTVVLPKRATERYIDATAELQDLLGELNDAAVARTMFLQLGKAAKLQKAVNQRLVANECEQLRQVEVRLMALAEMPTSWAT